MSCLLNVKDLNEQQAIMGDVPMSRDRFPTGRERRNRTLIRLIELIFRIGSSDDSNE